MGFLVLHTQVCSPLEKSKGFNSQISLRRSFKLQGCTPASGPTSFWTSQFLPASVGVGLRADSPHVIGLVWLSCFDKQLQTEGKILDCNLKAHWEILILPLIQTRAFNVATGIFFFPSPWIMAVLLLSQQRQGLILLQVCSSLVRLPRDNKANAGCHLRMALPFGHKNACACKHACRHSEPVEVLGSNGQMLIVLIKKQKLYYQLYFCWV